MHSRLDRLLLLLDTGSTGIVRTAAAKQLGDIQQSHPAELQNLLQKVTILNPSIGLFVMFRISLQLNFHFQVYVFLKSKSWESRVAAGEAITAIIQHVPLWGNCKGNNF